MTSNTACEVKTLLRQELSDLEWDSFVEQSPQRAPYARSWYLDVVWKEWQAIMAYHNGKLMAVMPIKVSKKYGLHYAFNPMLCQYTGIFFADLPLKNEQAWALKKRLVSAIAAAVPAHAKLVTLNFAPEFDYPLPFYWRGFELHTRFSYWLDNLEDKKAMLRNMDDRTRTYINKARKSGLTPQPTDDLSGIIGLSQERGAYPFDFQLLRSLWLALRENKMGHALEVRDAAGRLHAGLVFLIDGHKLIHLFSAIDPALRNQGGMSLAIWHTIEQAGPDIRIHDFEGSMLEPVEKFFRGFNTRPVPYLQVRKNSFPRPIRWVFGR